MDEYEKFELVLTALVKNSDIPNFVDDLEIGTNISVIPEVKVIFDGFGDLETDDVYEEGGNFYMQSFAVFLRRDAIKGEEFPEHDMTPWALIHRPKEEVCIYVWYDVTTQEYEVLDLDSRSFMDDEGAMTTEEVYAVTNYLYEKYIETN